MSSECLLFADDEDILDVVALLLSTLLAVFKLEDLDTLLLLVLTTVVLKRMEISMRGWTLISAILFTWSLLKSGAQ